LTPARSLLAMALLIRRPGPTMDESAGLFAAIMGAPMKCSPVTSLTG